MPGPDERRARAVEREAATDTAVRRGASLDELDQREVYLAQAARATIRRQRYEQAAEDARDREAEAVRLVCRYGVSVNDVAEATGLHPQAVRRLLAGPLGR